MLLFLKSACQLFSEKCCSKKAEIMNENQIQLAQAMAKMVKSNTYSARLKEKVTGFR